MSEKNAREDDPVQACPDPSGLGIPATGRHWTADDIPDLSGKRALVTGGAGGLGLATVRALAAHGAEVIIADINRSAGEAAAAELHGSCEYRHLDLTSLRAIADFAAALADRPLDILINNAGIYPPATRAETTDGFELEFGLNHLGHFALTAHLLPALQRTSAARVVSVSSITQAWGRLDFDDPQAQKCYQPDKIYARTKLACLMFGLELHERARAADSSLQSIVAHPGIARTTIGQERKQKQRGLRDRMEDAAQALAMRFFGQEPAQGALPMLYAATAQEAESGGFCGPHGLGQFSGYPVAVKPSKAALDAADRQRLWQLSEDCTGVSYRL